MISETMERDLREQFEYALYVLHATGHTIITIRRPDSCITIAIGPIASELDQAADRIIGKPQFVEIKPL